MREREMDDTYTAVAGAAAAKKKARKAAHTAPAMPPPLPEEEADGARGINQACLPCWLYQRWTCMSDAKRLMSARRP